MRTLSFGSILALSLTLLACDDGTSSQDLGDLAATVDMASASYKVGGSATGLAGSGLTLTLNGAEDLAVSADGAFSFTSALHDGASYAVGIKTQPSAPSQKCVLEGASGVIAGASSTSVKLTCTTPKFRVGGVVIGYVGAGLVLRNSGGDDLAVAANGAFQFATSVASGTSYTVTVKTQPSAPAQTCAVTGDTGPVGGADVSSVVVNCAANTYTVGGAVTGLTGTVELFLNGQYTVSVSSNTTFAFGAGLSDLAPYNVTVKTSPGPTPSQTCTVDKGNGQIAGGNVSNVKVSCVNTGYPVRVTVVGLGAGGSVIFQNGGADDLVISSNSTQTFSTPQKSGTAIAVVVFQQPGPIPTQTCVLTAGDPGATVTDRAVDVTYTCTSVPFTLKGNVTNLPIGQQITLRNNGGNPQVVTVNGPFSFGSILSGTNYHVTVSAQPAAPTYCSVSQSQGRIPGADVVLSVTCSVPTDCAKIFALDPTVPSGAYSIDPDGPGGAAAFSVYCDMVTAGGGWTIVYAATGGDNQVPITSDTAVNGNPLVGAYHNLTRAQKIALSSLSTESLFSRTDAESWLRVDKPMFDAGLAVANTRASVAVNLRANDGATALGFMGYSNYDITGGGDFGISMRPAGGTCGGGLTTVNGFDQHSASYRNLNCSCDRMYLYSYSNVQADSDAGYDINVGLGGWFSSDSCNGNEGGNLRFRAAMRRNIVAPSSCAAILAGNAAAGDGVYLLSSAASGTYPAYCDMVHGGYTLLLGAIGSSTFWGNNSANWKRTEVRSDPPTDLSSLTTDHRSGAYANLATNSVRLCFGGSSSCYTFTHGLNRELAQFFIQGTSYVQYAFNALFFGDTGSDTARTSFISALGFTMGGASCYWLGINHRQMNGGIGLYGDNNAGCASMGPQAGNFWMDDYALGLGLNSCNDGSCSPTNLTAAGRTESANPDGYFGNWYVFGK